MFRQPMKVRRGLCSVVLGLPSGVFIIHLRVCNPCNAFHLTASQCLATVLSARQRPEPGGIHTPAFPIRRSPEDNFKETSPMASHAARLRAFCILRECIFSQLVVQLHCFDHCFDRKKPEPRLRPAIAGACALLLLLVAVCVPAHAQPNWLQQSPAASPSGRMVLLTTRPLWGRILAALGYRTILPLIGG
jgi:hypothetical protein